MISRVLFSEDRKKKLRVFDFDDVLVKTKSFVYVRNDKRNYELKLTPGEYAVYNPKPNDEFDYSDFKEVKEPTEIKAVTKILKRIVQKSKETVFILTARANYRPIRRYLRDIGLNTDKIYVEALASSNPQDKANWIKNKIETEGYTDVYFADDSKKNVRAVKNILRKKDDELVRWRVQHIKY